MHSNHRQHAYLPDVPGVGVAAAVAVAGASGFFANSEPPKRPLPVDVGAGGAAELAAAGVVAGAASAGLGGRPKSPPPGVEEGAVAAVFVVVVLVACPKTSAIALET